MPVSNQLVVANLQVKQLPRESVCIGISEYRHSAPKLGVHGKFIGYIEQTPDNLLGLLVGKIMTNVFGDAIHIVTRLLRDAARSRLESFS